MALFRRNNPDTEIREFTPEHHDEFSDQLHRKSGDFSEFLTENEDQIHKLHTAWQTVRNQIDYYLNDPQARQWQKQIIEENLIIDQEQQGAPHPDFVHTGVSRRSQIKAVLKEAPLIVQRGIVAAKLVSNPQTIQEYSTYENMPIIHGMPDEDMATGGPEAMQDSITRAIADHVKDDLLPHLIESHDASEQLFGSLSTYLGKSYENFAGFMDWLQGAVVSSGEDTDTVLQVLAARLPHGDTGVLFNDLLETYRDEVIAGVENEFIADLIEGAQGSDVREWVLFAANGSNPYQFMQQTIERWPESIKQALYEEEQRYVNQLGEIIDGELSSHERRFQRPATLEELKSIDQILLLKQQGKKQPKSKAGRDQARINTSQHVDISEKDTRQPLRLASFERNDAGEYEVVVGGTSQTKIQSMVAELAAKFPSEKDFQADLERMIEHLRVDVVGPGKTKLDGHKIRIGGKGGKTLQLRRMSPHATPGLSVGEQASKVRIIYALDKSVNGGKPALVIHDIQAYGHGYEERLSRGK